MAKGLVKFSAMFMLLLVSCGVVEKLANRPPVIERMYATNYNVLPGDTTMVIVQAKDPDGDLLSYNWSKTGGTFVSPQENDKRVWQAPSQSGSYQISVVVRDENGGETGDKVTIVVRSETPPRVEIIHPVEGEFIPGIGSYRIEVRASHETAQVERVDFIIDGELQFTDKSPISNIYTYDWNIDGLSGPKTIVAKAYRLILPDPPGVDSVHVTIEGVTPFPLR